MDRDLQKELRDMVQRYYDRTFSLIQRSNAEPECKELNSTVLQQTSTILADFADAISRKL
jgi:hypothetical protein